MRRLVLATRKYRAGYVVRDELCQTNFEAVALGPPDKSTQELIDYFNAHRGDHVVMKSAYTPDGHYIGNPRMARSLIVKRGIRPELAVASNNVCSIGFCEKEQKWYGWSHRAMFGFGIGSIAKEGDCCTTSGWTEEYLEMHPEERDKVIPVGFEAKTLDDARRMAVAFAESVS